MTAIYTKLTNKEIERLTADLKADPSLVVQVANALPVSDATYLTYSLPNKLRKSLMDQYRLGLSRRPGFVVKVLYPRRQVVIRFVEAKDEDEAKALIMKKLTHPGHPITTTRQQRHTITQSPTPKRANNTATGSIKRLEVKSNRRILASD